MDIIEYVQNCFKLYLFEDSAYKYIDKKVDWVTAFFVVLGISLISNAITFVVNKTSIEEIMIGLLTTIFRLIIGVLIGYGILHLLFKLFKGKASFEELVKFGLSLSVFPSLLTLLLAFIPETMLTENMSVIIIVMISSLILGIWSLIVYIRIYSRLQGLSAGKTVLVLLIPILFALVLGLIIASFFLIGSSTIMPIQ